MTLLDLDKTTLKFWHVIWIIGIVLAIVGAAWRFETKMSSIEESTIASINSLRTEIVYKYTLELLKVNNRIDLIEAKKLVQRYNFKRTSSNNDVNVVINGRNANRDNHKKEKYPQFCMIPPRGIEYETRPKLPNIKKLMS